MQLTIELSAIRESDDDVCIHVGACMPIQPLQRFVVTPAGYDTVEDVLQKGIERLMELYSMDMTCLRLGLPKNEMNAVLAPSLKMRDLYPLTAPNAERIMYVTPMRLGTDLITSNKRPIDRLSSIQAPGPKRPRRREPIPMKSLMSKTKETTSVRQLRLTGGPETVLQRSPCAAADLDSSQAKTELEDDPDAPFTTMFPGSDAEDAADVDDDIVVPNSRVPDLRQARHLGKFVTPQLRRTASALFPSSQERPVSQQQSTPQIRLPSQMERSYEPPSASQPWRSSPVTAQTAQMKSSSAKKWTIDERELVAAGLRAGLSASRIARKYNLDKTDSAIRNCKRWLLDRKPHLLDPGNVENAAADRLETYTGRLNRTILDSDDESQSRSATSMAMAPTPSGGPTATVQPATADDVFVETASVMANVERLVRDSAKRKVLKRKSAHDADELVMAGGLALEESDDIVRVPGTAESTSITAVQNSAEEPVIDSDAQEASVFVAETADREDVVDERAADETSVTKTAADVPLAYIKKRAVHGKLVPIIPRTVVSPGLSSDTSVEHSRTGMTDAQSSITNGLGEDVEWSDGEGVGDAMIAHLSGDDRNGEREDDWDTRSFLSDLSGGGAQIVPKQVDVDTPGRILGDVSDSEHVTDEVNIEDENTNEESDEFYDAASFASPKQPQSPPKVVSSPDVVSPPKIVSPPKVVSPPPPPSVLSKHQEHDDVQEEESAADDPEQTDVTLASAAVAAVRAGKSKQHSLRRREQKKRRRGRIREQTVVVTFALPERVVSGGPP
ncbi:hypothetical protein LTR29_007389 [Friedmanniomyces endolithicus]|nr:hypothetical protein LTR29_007389 [Friedmanniomyces endolithicus]